MQPPEIPTAAEPAPDPWSPSRPPKPKPASKKAERYVVNVQRERLCLCCRDHEHGTDTYRVIFSVPDTSWGPTLEQATTLANVVARHEKEVHGGE